MSSNPTSDTIFCQTQDRAGRLDRTSCQLLLCHFLSAPLCQGAVRAGLIADGRPVGSQEEWQSWQGRSWARLSHCPMDDCQDQARLRDMRSDPSWAGHLCGDGDGPRPGCCPTSWSSLAWPTAGQSRAVASLESLSYNFAGAGTEGPKSWNGVLGHGQMGEIPRGRQGHWSHHGPGTPLLFKVTSFQEHFCFWHNHFLPGPPAPSFPSLNGLYTETQRVLESWLYPLSHLPLIFSPSATLNLHVLYQPQLTSSRRLLIESIKIWEIKYSILHIHSLHYIHVYQIICHLLMFSSRYFLACNMSVSLPQQWSLVFISFPQDSRHQLSPPHQDFQR